MFKQNRRQCVEKAIALSTAYIQIPFRIKLDLRKINPTDPTTYETHSQILCRGIK